MTTEWTIKLTTKLKTTFNRKIMTKLYTSCSTCCSTRNTFYERIALVLQRPVLYAIVVSSSNETIIISRGSSWYNGEVTGTYGPVLSPTALPLVCSIWTSTIHPSISLSIDPFASHVLVYTTKVYFVAAGYRRVLLDFTLVKVSRRQSQSNFRQAISHAHEDSFKRGENIS